MILQLSAVLWAAIGYFSGSTALFLAGAAFCIALNLIRIFLGQSSALKSILAYSVCYIATGSLSGVLTGGVIVCAFSAIAPGISRMYAPSAKQA